MTTKIKNNINNKLRPKSSTTVVSDIQNNDNKVKFSPLSTKPDKQQKKNFVKTNRIKSGHSEASVCNVYTVDKLVDDILNGKITNILCVVGAGISTPSGIPDFRSPGTGLYDNLKQFKIPYPEAIFDMEYFLTNPKPFFTLAKEIMPSVKYKPNKIHYFIRLLQEKQLLQRLYTQNIDGLERIAGINSDKLVEAHGTFSSAKCLGCKKAYPEEYVRKHVNSNQIPYCKKDNCSDVVKPNIVFFGENLPKRFDLHVKDFTRTDLVIIMGTSLEVEPFAGVVKASPSNVPRLLINREAVGPFKSCKRKTDLKMLGDLLHCLDELVAKLGWKNELEELIIKEIDKLDENFQRSMAMRSESIVEVKTPLDNKYEIETDDEKPLNQLNLKNTSIYKPQLKEPLKGNVNYDAIIPFTKKFSNLNDDLTRNEQLSGVYYLKDNYALNTHEVLSRRQQHQHHSHHQSEVADDIRKKIIQQNDGILGLTKKNIENHQALLEKRKQIDNYRNKHSHSDLSILNQNVNTSTDALLPPNYKAYIAKRNKINQSPYANKNSMFTQEFKITSKFYANSKALLNATLLNGTTRTPKLKTNKKINNYNDDDSTSSNDESTDESDD